MENKKHPRSNGPWCRTRFVLLLAAVATWRPATVLAAAVPLTQSDLVLGVYTSAGKNLDATALGGFFNPHRCLCADTTMTATVLLTDSGKTNLGTSTVAVSFLLGKNCSTTPTSCVSLGQVSFTQAQSATPPTFSSSQVFQTAAGSTTVDCANLTAGTTTVWAILAEDGAALPFVLSVDLPVLATAAPAPVATTALASDQGMLVTWTPPADTSQVTGYQVLCLPRPAAAVAAAYQTTCGLDSTSIGDTIMTPADVTEVCSKEVLAGTTSVRLAGLVNGTPYTVAVISIDQGGGVSDLSPPAVATPQPTLGFYETYKKDGGAASGCSMLPSPQSRRAGVLWMAFLVGLVVASARFLSRRRRRGTARVACATVLLLALGATAQAQIATDHGLDDWPSDSRAGSAAQRIGGPPDWNVELGLSLYRPDVDGEFSNGSHPYADTFSSSRHLMTEAELDRYFRYGFGTWGLGLRVGYYKVTAASFYDGSGTVRSGDETALRLIPFALSIIYRADGLAGLRLVPLTPYLKVGLDGVSWTGTNTGGSTSHTGFTPGWHAAAGIIIGLNALGLGTLKPEAIADPFALFFEWDYAAINGLGLGNKLHVGDSTWFAGIMFDL
ncbi:MAG TPA: MXAN_2562 family outer membrane beta-barrel protein [Polyangia bacterium]